jgi:hypothetical protein
MSNKDFQNGFAIGLASGGIVEQEYILPIGGDELGGVKNGGNVVINEDGTMFAPEGTGSGLSTDAKNLLITILRNGVYSTDQNNNITALATELGVIEDEPDTPDEPTTTDNVTVVDGVMTIFSVGSEITVSDGVVIFA